MLLRYCGKSWVSDSETGSEPWWRLVYAVCLCVFLTCVGLIVGESGDRESIHFRASPSLGAASRAAAVHVKGDRGGRDCVPNNLNRKEVPVRSFPFLATAALAVSACCGQLPGLPEVAFGPESEVDSNGSRKDEDRKAMSLEEAVAELRTFHEKVVGEAADGLCVDEVEAVFEVMAVKSKGGSVKLALVPLTLGRSRQRGVTAGSTVTVTYKNPECAPTETGASESTAAEAPQEAGGETE